MAAESYIDQMRRELSGRRLLVLTVITIQFGLIVAATRLTNLETVAFEQVLTLAFVGFLIHHFMPSAWRLGFFAVLSMASVPLVLGWTPGICVLAMGAVLILLCHIPAAFPLRVALILSVGLAMALDRAAVISGASPLVPQAVWPVLGAMFMFRLMVYLYDLKHQTAPFGASAITGELPAPRVGSATQLAPRLWKSSRVSMTLSSLPGPTTAALRVSVLV